MLRVTLRGVGWLRSRRARHIHTAPAVHFSTDAVRKSAVQMLELDGTGRGWFATKKLVPGDLIFEEVPARSRNVDDLAHIVMGSERLSKGLHVPASFANAGAWSRSVAQVISNGFRSPDGAMLLLQDASLFNHSCRPNAAVGNPGGDKVQVRAIRNVKEGQELCICYDSALFWLPTERRRPELRRRWGFECGCPRCTGAGEDEVEGLITRMCKEGARGADSALVEHIDMQLDRSDALIEHALVEKRGGDEVALNDAVRASKKALTIAAGTYEATHWRVRRVLVGLSKCMFHLQTEYGDGDVDGSLDFDMGYQDGKAAGELKRVLRICMAVERSVVAPLHPMRLETFGLWEQLEGEGDDWKLGGALQDLAELKVLWEGVDGENPRSPFM